MGRYKGNDHPPHENDNHANQLNPDHEAYWQSRGFDDRPDGGDDFDDTAGDDHFLPKN